MLDASQPVSLNELLAHARFVQSLSRDLVQSGQDADDLAQETWLTALKKRPGKEGSLRGWFRQVVRNRARQERRSRGRRELREASAVHPRVRNPPEIVEHEAMLRLVSSAVLELRSPYRTVILLRFYEGLPPRSIADRLGIKVETVRSQLRRGLEHLRGRLDREHGGDRGAWVGAMVPMAGLDACVSTSSPLGMTLPGVLAMSLKIKIATVMLLAAFVVLFAFSFFSTGEYPSNLDGPRSVARTESDSTHSFRDAQPVSKTLVEDSLGVPPLAEEIVSAIVPKESREFVPPPLEIEVTGEDGLPVASAVFAVYRGEDVLITGRTDERGRATMEARTGVAEFVVAMASMVPYRVSISIGPGTLLISLPPLAEVSGRLRVDFEPPNEPIELTLRSDRPLVRENDYPAEVWLVLERVVPEKSVLTETVGRDGVFCFSGLPYDWTGTLNVQDGYYYLDREVGDSDWPVKKSEKLNEPVSGLALALGKLGEIRGRVVNEKRQALEGAIVDYDNHYVFETEGGGTQYWNQGRVWTNEEGVFRIRLVGHAPRSIRLEIHGPDAIGFRQLEIEGVDLLPVHDVGDVVLGLGRRVSFTVIDPSGSPVSGAVAFVGSGSNAKNSAPTDEFGKVELNVSPSVESVMVVAMGFHPESVSVPKDLDASLEVIMRRSSRLTIKIDDPWEGTSRLLSCELAYEKPLFAEMVNGGPLSMMSLIGATPWTYSGSSAGEERYRAGNAGFFFDEESEIRLTGLNPEVAVRLRLFDGMGMLIAEREESGLGPTEHRRVVFRLERKLRTFRGRVEDPAGRPLVEATVSVEIDRGARARNTGDEGEFLFEGCYAESIRLLIGKDGFESQQYDDYLLPPDGEEVVFVLEPIR